MAKPNLVISLCLAASCSIALAAPAGAFSSERGMEYAAFVMSGLDRNQDGLLTREEFLISGHAHFDEIDRNGDGVATPKEIADWYVAYLKS